MSRPLATRRNLLRAAGLCGLLCVGVFQTGCQDDTERLLQFQTELRELRRENAALKAEVHELRLSAAKREKLIQRLRGLGEKRLDLLFTVARIELGRYTAGADLDGKPGHDGVRVYLRPLDRDGHAIKAAGSVTVRLFDLDRQGDNLLATCEFPVEKIAAHWHGGFGTYHYRFDCPWKRPPTDGEVTVRVVFTDYLTGRSFSAQKLLKVKPPAAP